MFSKFLYKKINLLIFLILLLYTAKINWRSGQWQHLLEADAKGYYAYLPAAFIYQDLNFNFFDQVEKKGSDPLYYDYRAYHNGYYIDKYYAGTAICLLPFYTLAHFFSDSAGPTAGYGQLHMIFLCIAACFYAYLGLFYLKKILETYTSNKLAISATLLLTLFGTNLFYYVIGEPGMSHVYSFCFFSMFIYYSQRYFKHRSASDLYLLSACLGLIILIRPVNAIILLSLPFLSGSYPTLKSAAQDFFSSKKRYLVAGGLVAGIVFIQCVIYKIQTGHFFVYSYHKEGFNFLNPHFFDFLFSYKKGFFLYTPICLLALSGLIKPGFSSFQRLSFLFFICLVIYVFSSWWMWYYGGSFSSRVMVEFLPFFAILLVCLLDLKINIFLKTAISAMLFILLILNQVQTLQYRYYLIHWAEMDKKKYWDVFLDLKPILNREESKNTD